MTCEEFQKLIEDTQEVDQTVQDAYDQHYVSCTPCKEYLDKKVSGQVPFLDLRAN